MDIVSDLYTQALNLPPAERALLAEKIWNSLPDDEAAVSLNEEWAAEIARRIENHRLGRAKTVDFETFRATLREAANGRASS